MTNTPLRVALVNDYEIVLAGVREMLAPHSSMVEVVELDANTPVRQRVDIALYDTYGQDAGSLRSVHQVLATHLVERVVLYCWNFDQHLVERAIDAGISGVLAKSLDGDQLVASLAQIGRGERVISPRPLTPRDLSADHHGPYDWPGRLSGLTMREAEMIALIAQGLSNAEIAERTSLSPNSIKSYIRAAYRKIGVQRRAQAVAWGIDHGLTPDRKRLYA